MQVLDYLYKLYNEDTVIVDTETTGLSKNDEVIDFAAVVFRKSAKILYYQRYFLPSTKISPFAARVHKMDSTFLKNVGASSFAEHAYELNSLLNKYNVITFNASFDKRLLSQTFAKNNLKMLDKKWHCALRMYELLFDEKVRLQNACANFNVPAGKHSALSDALALRGLLFKILHDNDFSL